MIACTYVNFRLKYKNILVASLGHYTVIDNALIFVKFCKCLNYNYK